MFTRQAAQATAAAAAAVSLALLCVPASADLLNPGDTAPDFALPAHDTGEIVHLHDFAGQVVVLDFFHHDCHSCHTAADELGLFVQAHYEGLGGNPAGLAVQVLPISLGDPDTPEVDDFIADHNLGMVLHDDDGSLLDCYGDGGIPQFVIINGASGANYGQWEIIAKPLGYWPDRYLEFRGIIDAVTPEPSALCLLAVGAITAGRRRRSR